MLIHKRIIQQTLLVLYFLLSYNGVQGRIKLSKQEDSELEEQLKLLNKPSVKIMKVYIEFWAKNRCIRESL